MIKRIFKSETKTVGFAAFLIAVSVFVSRVLGLVRDRLLAGRFGAGEELDIYFAAFRIPDFVYGILIVGGITAAFLPVFSEYFKRKEERWPEGALEFTSNVINSFLVLLVLICGLLAFLTPYLIKFIAPGFSGANKELTIALTRIMFLSPVLFGLSSIFSGVLHYFNRFLAYSLAPILYNLGIIFGILFLVPLFGVYGLVYGVILGALFHLLIQIPAAFSAGFKYKPVLNFKFPGLIKLFKLMIPRTIGTAAYHINLIVITSIASTLTAGSIAIFNFSNNLHYVPIGLIGISFAVSSFPVFSRFWAEGQKEKFLANFSLSFRQILFLIVPIIFLIFLLRAQIVRLVLGTGEFGWWETRLTAACLGVFALGIFGGSLNPLLTRAFFALKDTKTPVLISLISMGLNVALSFLFVFLLKGSFLKTFFVEVLRLKGIENISVIGLPLALSLAVSLQFVLMLFFLYKKIGGLGMGDILSSFGKILSASLLMVVISFFIRQITGKFFGLINFWDVLFQTGITALAAFIVYLLLAFVLKSPEVSIVRSYLLKRFSPLSKRFNGSKEN